MPSAGTKLGHGSYFSASAAYSGGNLVIEGQGAMVSIYRVLMGIM